MHFINANAVRLPPAFLLLLCTFWALRAFALVKAKQKANALPGKVIILMSHLEREREIKRESERGLERQPNYNIITHTETLSFDIRERERETHTQPQLPQVAGQAQWTLHCGHCGHSKSTRWLVGASMPSRFPESLSNVFGY